MRVSLLTTDTPHHTYYAWRLAELFPLQAIVIETRAIAAPFETAHPFERERDQYERSVLLEGFHGTLRDIAPVCQVETLQSADAQRALLELAPEIILIFGTAKCPGAVIDSASVACLNLHGGNPEWYRGLDTHLWAIYHGEFDQLVTTLHYTEAALDVGAIVLQTQLMLSRESRLPELRSLNTKACVDLSLAALQCVDAGRALPARRQTQRGRYYSFMPAVLKTRCVEKFERHVRTL